jgi:ribosomal protein S18 acetylase RimI-like enzyme
VETRTHSDSRKKQIESQHFNLSRRIHLLKFDTNDGIAVSIRLARLDDAPTLQKNCLPGNTIGEVEDFLRKDVEAMSKGDKVRLVEDVEGEVVGNLEIAFNRHPLWSHTAEINTVIVSSQFRRRNIATKLIDAVFKIAQDRCLEILKICVEGKNASAIRLYEKTGFKEYGRLERGIIRKGEYDDLILLKKDL